MDMMVLDERSAFVSPRTSRVGTAKLLPSQRYTWRNLDPQTFPIHGVIARRDPRGRPTFNFQQTVWLYEGIGMDWGPRLTRSVEVLAVNILSWAIPSRDYHAAYGWTSYAAVHAARRFAEDVLTQMPVDGGCISHEFCADWVRENAPTPLPPLRIVSHAKLSRRRSRI